MLAGSKCSRRVILTSPTLEVGSGLMGRRMSLTAEQRRAPRLLASDPQHRAGQNRELAKVNHGAAIERDEALRTVFAELAGLSAHKAADELNSRGVATPTGAPWSAKTVLRVRERACRLVGCRRSRLVVPRHRQSS